MLENKQTQMSMKQKIIFSILVIIVIIVIKAGIGIVFPSDMYSNWKEQDFIDQHCSHLYKVAKYCTNGDYDLAVQYMEEPNVLNMYKYAEEKHIYPEMIQSYLFVYNAVGSMDEMLKNAVRFYIYGDKYVVLNLDTMTVFLETANTWAPAEMVNQMYATLRDGFMDYKSDRGILYKYSLKMAKN